ncbi:EH signature domain-containing protein [Spirulina sp. CS-785/01]|uniref:EH signature domain-containing protein n=1 Tax=Spirulina sp. CS-785/01 TaxID=3021716 RepID=UPI00233061E0|nr:EH signature domain-containing protein [Spirulina sp. CS-785/01]MDB9312028.1 EH signature domain-containing protein [Spirulina sp. CS-785/01]
MTLTFRSIYLPLTPEPNCQELINLATSYGQNNSFSTPELPRDVPKNETNLPRKIEDIIADIEQGKPENITILEWVYCFYGKAQWDTQQSDERKITTARSIWTIAQSNEVLKFQLFWRLAVYLDDHDNEPDILAPSIVDCFQEFADHFAKTTPLIIQILLILKKFSDKPEAIQEMARLSWKNLQLPKTLLKSAKLPQTLQIAEATLTEIIHQFTQLSNPTQSKVNLLLDCFTEISDEAQVKEVEYLLLHYPKEKAVRFSQLIKWLQKYYGSATRGSRWEQLSVSAQTALNNWMGALQYGYFRDLVEQLLRILTLQPWEINQLRSRSKFWSNYSDRFRRIHIFLPPSSQTKLGRNFQHQDISLLQEDGSDMTEVCVFDFGELCIVEFFRGRGSETRVFSSFNNPQYLQLKQVLFEGNKLSIKKIRSLGGEVHDHQYVWQYFCEKFLRERGIYPNEEVTQFIGIPAPHNQYDRNTGLQKPSPQQLQDREEKLHRWNKTMKAIERELNS